VIRLISLAEKVVAGVRTFVRRRSRDAVRSARSRAGTVKSVARSRGGQSPLRVRGHRRGMLNSVGSRSGIRTLDRARPSQRRKRAVRAVISIDLGQQRRGVVAAASPPQGRRERLDEAEINLSVPTVEERGDVFAHFGVFDSCRKRSRSSTVAVGAGRSPSCRERNRVVRDQAGDALERGRRVTCELMMGLLIPTGPGCSAIGRVAVAHGAPDQADRVARGVRMSQRADRVFRSSEQAGSVREEQIERDRGARVRGGGTATFEDT